MFNRKPDTRTKWTRIGDRVAWGLLICLFVGGVFTFMRVKRPLPLTAADAGDAGSAPLETDVQAVRAEETEQSCRAALREAGVTYQSVPRADAGDVEWAMLLTAPVGGVRIHGTGKPGDPTNILDCRLARALLDWAPRLRAKGIVGLEHYSMYRAEAVVGKSSKPSGHASGLAIDVAKVELDDGRVLSVLEDWKNRKRGADPCRSWADEAEGRLLRGLACEAGAEGLFQTIVTPHHNDAHGNHVHFEVVPLGAPLWIH